MSVSGMMSAFERAKRRYTSGPRSYSPLEAEALGVVAGLEKEALAAVYAENEAGGHARQAVADVARVLGVDIDEGTGHRWDPDHMARVVERAAWVAESRDYWEAEERKTRLQAEAALDEATTQAALWKSLAERQDNAAQLRTELSTVKRERDELERRLEYAQCQVRSLTDGLAEGDVDELKATIVRQAREITRLKGDSE